MNNPYFAYYATSPLYYSSYYNELISENYITWNQIEKYYCISFALDYYVFDIWSRDYPRREIDWDEEINGDGTDDEDSR